VEGCSISHWKVCRNARAGDEIMTQGLGRLWLKSGKA
jgi:hypothetical protein